MSFLPHDSAGRASFALGLTVLAAAGLATLALLTWLTGPIVGAAAGIVFAASVCLAFLRRGDNPTSRDPSTGLPDRDGALAALATILRRSGSGQHEAAVIVVALDTGDAALDAEDRRAMTLVAAVRMAQRLRKGDQIVHLGETSLAAILGPSFGLTAQATEGVLVRIERMFGDPLRIAGHSLEVDAAVGACLQHDAPGADASSWLEAAEEAARMAARDGRPRLFPSGATSIDCLYEPSLEAEVFAADPHATGPRAEEARWRAAEADGSGAAREGSRRA
jgi:GGDEF domain-containing protein